MASAPTLLLGTVDPVVQSQDNVTALPLHTILLPASDLPAYLPPRFPEYLSVGPTEGWMSSKNATGPLDHMGQVVDLQGYQALLSFISLGGCDLSTRF